MPKLKWIEHADLAIRKTPSVGRQEYLDHMTFHRNDRPLFTEIFGPLVGLKEEWEEQGARSAELDFSAFRYRCENRGFLSANTGRIGGYQEVILEENDQFRIYRDELGRTMKLAKGFATLPLPQDYPVRALQDWMTIKPWYEFRPDRLDDDWEKEAHRFQQEERVICLSIPGGFDEPRQLIRAPPPPPSRTRAPPA